MLSLVALGAWLPMHVLPRLQLRVGLTTGVLQLGLLTVLSLTGYGLYYLADDASRSAWSVTHWVAGLSLPVLLLIHRGPYRAGRE